MTKQHIEIRECLLSGSADEPQLYGDLYLPDQTDAKNSPAIVLIFGGSWRSSDRSQQKGYGLALAKAGFICLATDYRYSSEARWPAQLDDVKTAVRWLRAQAAEFGIDAERIAVSGNSSGAHLALMLAATADDPVPAAQVDAEWSEYSSKVCAVCAFYPPTSLSGLDDYNDDDTVSSLLGVDAAKLDYDNASPLTYAAKQFPPVLLISGNDDKRVPIENTYDLHAALSAAGNTVELHVFAGQEHAFDADREFAGVTVAIMVNFFRRYA
jgi:acetyl esterase/lipase